MPLYNNNVDSQLTDKICQSQGQTSEACTAAQATSTAYAHSKEATEILGGAIICLILALLVVIIIRRVKKARQIIKQTERLDFDPRQLSQFQKPADDEPDSAAPGKLKI